MQELELFAAMVADLLPPPDRPLLTVRGLAERLAVSEKTAKILVHGDPRRNKPPEIASFLIGERMRRIDPADVDAYLDGRR